MSEEIEAISGAAGTLLAVVAGTAAGETSGWLADVVRGRRIRTQIKILLKTEEALREAGLSARAVPHKTLVPLLELAGLEDPDDEPMADRWSRLLAHAGTGSEVPPSFPHVLGQLSSTDAQLLEAIGNAAPPPSAEGGRWAAGEVVIAQLPPQLRSAIGVDNLVRLRLVATVLPTTLDSIMDNAERVTLTAFGAAFLARCTAFPAGT